MPREDNISYIALTYFIIALLLIASDSVMMGEEVNSSEKATCTARFSPFAVRTGIRLVDAVVGVDAISEGTTSILLSDCCCCCCCICKRTGGGIITLTFGFGNSEGFLTIVVASELTCVACVDDSLAFDDNNTKGGDCGKDDCMRVYMCECVEV
ncbi:hypothetical protein GQX74_012965 [Glossina fuscipes]|nr:hypothetical protein GQX74_012965 [Glossina fuscipes]